MFEFLDKGKIRKINPYTAGGHRMAEILAKPQVEDSISIISSKHSDLNLTIDEISLAGLGKYDGVTIKDSKIKEDFSISIVGIIKKNGKTQINPLSDTVLEIEDTILFIGENEDMDKFKLELP